MYRYNNLLRIRYIILLVLMLALFSQLGCSSSINNRDRSSWSAQHERKEDLSKIYLDFVTSSSDSISIEARKNLKQAIRQQLLEENLLQEDITVHSLALKTVILSYENNIFEVQAELYDDDEFLVYSRVKRQIFPNDDWMLAEQLIAEQLLDELITNLRARTAYIERLRPNADYTAYAAYPIGVYYGSWGWWRHKRDHDVQEKNPGGRSRHQPPKHWVSDAVIESLPRSHEVAAEQSSRKPRPSTPPSRWAIPSSHSTGNTSDSSDSNTNSGANSGGYGSGTSSEPSYFPPSEQAPKPADSRPSYSPPQSHPSSPPPRSREPSSTPRASESSSRSGGVSGAVPGSHRRKRGDE